MEVLPAPPRAEFCLCWRRGNSYAALAGRSLGSTGFGEGRHSVRKSAQETHGYMVISRNDIGGAAEVR